MPVEVVSYMLSNKDIRMRIGFQLILQCAPFLKGIKVASITNVDRRHLKEFWRVLDGTGIDAKILTVSQERCMVFIYRETALKEYLRRREVWSRMDMTRKIWTGFFKNFLQGSVNILVTVGAFPMKSGRFWTIRLTMSNALSTKGDRTA